MNVWSDRIVVGAVAAALAALLAIGFTARGTSAQTATPVPVPRTTPICPNYLDLATVPIDPALSATISAKWDEGLKGIELSWSAQRPANCAFFQVNGLSESGNIAGAEWVLAPGSGTRWFPATTPGMHCYRLYALSWAGRSEASDACAEVPVSAIGTPRPPGNYPAPSGTPWPAPMGVQLEGSVLLLDDNNFPLRPENQAWFMGISWSVLAGFTGSYEVQRARSEPGFEQRWESLRSGQFPASAAVAGRIGFEEQVSPGSIWCFRVRANINRETGPFSEPVCMPRPPSSGGSGPAPGPATPAPLPPEVGNSYPFATSPEWIPVLASALAALLGLGGVAGLRMRR